MRRAGKAGRARRRSRAWGRGRGVSGREAKVRQTGEAQGVRHRRSPAPWKRWANQGRRGCRGKVRNGEGKEAESTDAGGPASQKRTAMAPDRNRQERERSVNNRSKKNRGASCVAEVQAEHTATTQGTCRTERHKDGEQTGARHNMSAQASQPEAVSGTSGPRRGIRHHRSKPRADRSRSTTGSDAGHQSRERSWHRRSFRSHRRHGTGREAGGWPASFWREPERRSTWTRQNWREQEEHRVRQRQSHRRGQSGA